MIKNKLVMPGSIFNDAESTRQLLQMAHDIHAEMEMRAQANKKSALLKAIDELRNIRACPAERQLR